VRFTSTNSLILILGLIAAGLVNYLASSYFSSAYDHLRVAEHAKEVADADVQLATRLRGDLATLDRMLSSVPQDRRVSTVVYEVRTAAQRSGVTLATVQANGTPSFTAAGSLGGLLKLFDSMAAWPVPLHVSSMNISGQGSKLVVNVNATL